MEFHPIPQCSLFKLYLWKRGGGHSASCQKITSSYMPACNFESFVVDQFRSLPPDIIIGFYPASARPRRDE